MEHSLTQSVRLALFTLPIGYRRPRLVPECRMIFTLTSMEDLPMEHTTSVAQVRAQLARHIDNLYESTHLAQGCLNNGFVLDRIERAS